MGRWVLLLLLLLLDTTTHLGFLTMALGGGGGGGGGGSAMGVVNLVGEGQGAEEEEMMVSETTRRLWGLQQHRRYISYDLLGADVVPCPIPGVLYYNCRADSGARVNAYHRGCGVISRCARYDNP